MPNTTFSYEDDKPFSRAAMAGKLNELREWLLDQIDGGDECRGRDGEISTHIDSVEWALIVLGERP